jgi:hypothetical protein
MLEFMLLSFRIGLFVLLNQFPDIMIGIRCRPNCPANFSKWPASAVPH